MRSKAIHLMLLGTGALGMIVFAASAFAAGGEKGEHTFALYRISPGEEHGFEPVRLWIPPVIYREGDVILAGKKRRLVLVDRNGNGRFNDPGRVGEVKAGSDRTISRRPGDVFILDPDPGMHQVTIFNELAEPKVHPVTELVSVDGSVYRFSASPAGDRITFEPLADPVGFVANPNESFSALVQGKRGIIKIRGGGNLKPALPAGQWRLVSYVIAPEPEGGAGRETNSFSHRYGTLLRASATGKSPWITVKEGKTAYLPFGPPLNPMVRWVGSLDKKRTARLELEITGVGGEKVTDLLVKGRKPIDPALIIKKPDGEVVTHDRFHFG